jgi:hypothetical protein
VKTYPLDFDLAVLFLLYMYLRKIKINKDGKQHCYWALVESVRTARGPRQQVVAHLGEIDESGRMGFKQAAEGRTDFQSELFDEEPEWIEINVHAIRTEFVADFGDAWLAI